MRTLSVAVATVALLVAQGCAVNRTDYAAYLKHFPKSVLVLPPINESLEVQASGMFLSTITTLLAERGYYVLPVAVVDAVLKDNGVPLPPEMHRVSLEKLQDVFDPDAVLAAVWLGICWVPLMEKRITQARVEDCAFLSFALGRSGGGAGEFLDHRDYGTPMDMRIPADECKPLTRPRDLP